MKVQRSSTWTFLITNVEAAFLVYYYKVKSSDQHLGLKSGFRLVQKNVARIHGYRGVCSYMDHKAFKGLLRGSLQCADEPMMSSHWTVRAFHCPLESMVPEELEIVGRHWNDRLCPFCEMDRLPELLGALLWFYAASSKPPGLPCKCHCALL